MYQGSLFISAWSRFKVVAECKQLKCAIINFRIVTKCIFCTRVLLSKSVSHKTHVFDTSEDNFRIIIFVCKLVSLSNGVQWKN